MSDLIPRDEPFNLPAHLEATGWRLTGYRPLNTRNRRMGLNADAIKIVLTREMGNGDYLRVEVTMNRPDQIALTKAVTAIAQLAEAEPAGFRFEVAKEVHQPWDR
jgi:hypothetical protein